MNTEKEAEFNEHIKKKYEARFTKLIENQTQAENEGVITGEKYILKSRVAQAKEQVIEFENRVSIIEKFTIIDNKLAFDGVICEVSL